MNKRLQQIYSNIAKNNLKPFLQNNLLLDRAWGQRIWGITIQIKLGAKIKKTIRQIQAELDRLEPNNLLLLSDKYQHISFNQVVFWKDKYKLGKHQTWDKIKDKFVEEFNSLDNTFPSFSITFDQLVPTTGGIIWCAEDTNDELEKLRNIFFKKLSFPKETTYFNHIIHITIARYKNPLINPGKVYQYLQNKSLSTSLRVNELSLINELIFPSIKTKQISEISLK